MLDGDLVDFTGGVPEIGFEFGPISIVKATEEDAEAVIGTFDGPEGLSEEGFEEMDAVGSSVLDMDFAMAGLREDEGKPDTGEPAVRNTLMEVMSSPMLFESRGELHLLEEADQQ